MKRICVLIIFGFISISSFSQKTTEDILVEAFLNSREYNEAKVSLKVPGYDLTSLAKYGSYVKYLDDDKSKPVLYIMLGTGSYADRSAKLIGEFQVVKVSNNYNRAPNGWRYLISFRDYSNYNIFTSTGNIKYYDVNYDAYLAGEISYLNGIVERWDTYQMPEAIMIKYNFNEYNIDRNKVNHYCDANRDKDISFGECYRCMKNACNGNPECKTLCDFGNKHPFPGVLKNQCKLSMAVSCVIIAAAM